LLERLSSLVLSEWCESDPAAGPDVQGTAAIPRRAAVRPWARQHTAGLGTSGSRGQEVSRGAASVW